MAKLVSVSSDVKVLRSAVTGYRKQYLPIRRAKSTVGLMLKRGRTNTRGKSAATPERGGIRSFAGCVDCACRQWCAIGSGLQETGVAGAVAIGRPTLGDRKSTRLNSSHLGI